ncbi:MAG: imidazoleglycerol-phosphate dehydratase HisB, partial [Elusimicrobiota bacterium]
VKRKTKETTVNVEIDLHGNGRCNISTDIPFINHMLELFAFHGNFDLKIKATGDTVIDNHHLVEDIGITLGQAIKEALGNRKGITRYGSFLMPMDEALSYIVIDISSRPFLSFKVKFKKVFSIEFDYGLIEDFFKALVSNAGMTLHIRILNGKNNHHIAESIFKGFGKALAMAVTKAGSKKILSTKGKL